MRFLTHKRRNPPSVIIVSLIDVLMVVLIFLMVSTTFKQQPSVKIVLPESKQGKEGTAQTTPVIVTVARQAPFLYIDTRPVTLEKLQSELQAQAANNPQTPLFIRADSDAPFGQIVKVMDAAKAAGLKSVSAFTKAAGQ